MVPMRIFTRLIAAPPPPSPGSLRRAPWRRTPAPPVSAVAAPTADRRLTGPPTGRGQLAFARAYDDDPGKPYIYVKTISSSAPSARQARRLFGDGDFRFLDAAADRGSTARAWRFAAGGYQAGPRRTGLRPGAWTRRGRRPHPPRQHPRRGAVLDRPGLALVRERPPVLAALVRRATPAAARARAASSSRSTRGRRSRSSRPRRRTRRRSSATRRSPGRRPTSTRSTAARRTRSRRRRAPSSPCGPTTRL